MSERQYDVETMAELSPNDRRILVRDWYDDWFQGTSILEMARRTSTAPRVLQQVFHDYEQYQRYTD